MVAVGRVSFCLILQHNVRPADTQAVEVPPMYPAPFQLGRSRLQQVVPFFLSWCRLSRCLGMWACVFCVLCAVFAQPAYAEPGTGTPATQWVLMPAGSRATYIGIHGGTVPVSLLTSRDGTHMVALVGLTGNDFLRTLKVDTGTTGALSPMPSGALSSPEDEEDADTADAGPASQPSAATDRAAYQLSANATLLMAGTAVGAMPVIYATGHSFASLNQLYTDSLLFGLSENSPLLEGAVKAPAKALTKAKAAKRRQARGGSDTVTQ